METRLTPELKAKDLIEKFETILNHKYRYWKSEAIECAIFHCDEIIQKEKDIEAYDSYYSDFDYYEKVKAVLQHHKSK